jgi:hypothetical protein
MQNISSAVVPRKAPPLRWLFLLAAALVAIFALSTPGWADTCTVVNLVHPITCTIPEQNPELTSTITLTGLSLTAQAQGMVLIWDDKNHTLLSDVVTFTNVGNVATVAFTSDTDGVVVVPPGLTVLGSFTESDKPFFISLALGNGQSLKAKICSDVNENTGCHGGSDSIGLSLGTSSVPEPGTFVLLGTGIVGSGAWRLAAGSLGRRLLKRIRT